MQGRTARTTRAPACSADAAPEALVLHRLSVSPELFWLTLHLGKALMQ
jgi:hypothetical protein